MSSEEIEQILKHFEEEKQVNEEQQEIEEGMREKLGELKVHVRELKERLGELESVEDPCKERNQEFLLCVFYSQHVLENVEEERGNVHFLNAMKVDTDLDTNFQEAKQVYDKIMRQEQNRGFLIRTAEARKYEDFSDGDEEGLDEQQEDKILEQLDSNLDKKKEEEKKKEEKEDLDDLLDDLI